MPFGFDFAPFDSAAPGQTVLLLVRLAVLFWVAVHPSRRGVVAGLGALLLASIVARIFVLPDVLASFAALIFVPRRVVVAAAAAAALAIAFAFVPPRPVAERPTNLWHARAAALEAARHESPPGAAYVALAEVDDALGRRDQARKVLEKVRTKGTDEAARARATALEASW